MKLAEIAKDYGSGYGDGDGYGYGYGCGSGYGDGDGYGYGYGCGSGSGYGDGYGYGCGSGCGSGCGDGDGSSYGSKTDWFKTLLESYARPNIHIGFWRSNKDGTPANGGGGHPRKLGEVEEIQGPLQICTERALHATTNPDQWKGERWWIVGLHEPIQREGDKMASLKREIIADLGLYPF